VLELLIETLRMRSAAGALKYGTHLKPFNGRDALIDLLQELADGCMYVMQVIAERDSAQAHERGGEARMVAALERAEKWEEKAQELAATIVRERSDRDAAVKAGSEAMERMERDLYLRLNKVEMERNAARRAAEDWQTTATEYKRWRDVALEQVAELQAEVRVETQRHMVAVAQRDQERQVADTWEARYRTLAAQQSPPTGPQCELHKAKEFGPATYVVRRCKLVDGHEGMCEPA
jgi:hypothetical protein